MSDGNKSPLPESFGVEITDLEPLEHAGESIPTRLKRLLLRWQQPEHRRARRWLSNSMFICLSLFLLAVLLNPSVGITNLLATYWPSSQAQPSVTIQNLAVEHVFVPTSNEIRCPVATAWSPDSTLVALLGYTQSCAQRQYVPAQVNLYDAATNRQVEQWSPDEAILTVLQKYPGVSASLGDYLDRKPDFVADHGGALIIHYLHLLWSPHTARLALSFVAVNYVFTYAGVFLANADGSHSQVLLQPERAGLAPNSLTPLLWNLQQGSVTTFSTLPPALAYTWDGHDQLVPLHPLDAQTDFSAYTNSPPGDPVRASSFTIWQPGHLARPASNVYLWSTNFAVWSPDERYLITNFTFTGLLEPPDQPFPSTQSLHTLGVQDVPRVPAHDLALLLSASACAQVFAWNPAGTLLAVSDPTGFVDLYASQTGSLVRQFHTLRETEPLVGAPTLLSWSPDGHFLLLSNSQGALMTLWGPALLPHIG